MKYLAGALRNEGWMTVVLGHRESGPDALRAEVHKSGLKSGLLALTTDPAPIKIDSWVSLRHFNGWVVAANRLLSL